MGREVLLTVLSCFILKSESVKVINVAGPLLNNVAATSLPRLYRNVPLGVYASNTPYGANSFQVPNFAPPKSNQVVPVKQEKIVIKNSNGFLKDSYGNTYHETPQSLAYKTIYPQQHVQLQNLPAHLSQPLGINPSFQFKQGTPHFFGPAQYTIQSNVQGFSGNAPRYTISQPIIYGSNAGNGLTFSQAPKQQTQQPSTSKDVYVETHSSETPSETKFYRIEQLSTPASYTTATNEQTTKQAQQSSQTKTVPKKVHFENEMSYITDVNGQKTEVKIETKPPVPLLDISLLEPLTFDNPLVPQVQHFLPRIHDATYHRLPNINHANKHQKEFVVQNTKIYDTSSPKSPKRKHKKKKPHKEDDDDDEVKPTPSTKGNGSPNNSPEFSYEVNSPNYKETYSEQKVSYNKESESEPVRVNYEKQTENEPITYSYEKHTESKPIHYSYVHDSSKPEEIKETHYHREEEPKHLVFGLNSSEDSNSDEDAKHHKEERNDSPHSHKELSQNHSAESLDSGKHHHSSKNKNHNDHKEHHHHHHHHGRKKHHPKSEHREKTSKNHEHRENHGNSGYDEHSNSKPKHTEHHFQPVSLEYEEDITILPKYKPHSDSNVDRHEKHHDHKHNNHHSHSTKSYKPHFHNTQDSSSPSIQENYKTIVIKDDSLATDGDGREENEENFEKAYKNAAYGFPAYDRPVDVEKDIYNPESYGSSNYPTHFDVEHNPLAQYQAQGDEFPQDTRASYKDANDKMKEEYFLDYAISRPTSILDRFKEKENYYKMFEKQKPQRYYVKQDDKRSNAYTLQPTFSFMMPKNRANAKLSVSPYVYEYDYSKAAPKQDNSAYATQPFQRYKSNTQFVEPQFQYGFDPISIPRLLDSELAAMASNDHVESEDPGTRKKIYKENFYIKKTTTANGR